MSLRLFPLKKALQVFGMSLGTMEAENFDFSKLPPYPKSGGRRLKSYGYPELVQIGEQIGFLKKPDRPLVVSVFVTKGGVLKSSLTLNLARVAALHGIKTCVVGLDMQGDVSTALGVDLVEEDDSDTFDQAVGRMSDVQGLSALFTGDANLEDLILPTEIPTLSYIPETPELVALDQSLVNRNRREYWLADQVIVPLKKQFDLILLDGSPNWNRLTTNALVACDVLISPLECKINNFRNFKTFASLLQDFKNEMRTGFRQIYVPTRFNTGRKLATEILDWYRQNLPECTDGLIREAMQGEEAVAVRQSLLEYAPTSVPANEMRELLKEIWLQLDATTAPALHHERQAEMTI